MKILAFDISSSTIGYAVLTVDLKTKEKKLISVDYFKPIKEGTILERLENTRNNIKIIIENIKPDHIAIEEIIMYLPKRSSAQTVITLAVFNRMIGLLALDYLGNNPKMLGVLAIRHGLKLTKKFPDKSDMPELVAKHLAINFPYEYGKKGKPIIENEDKADAIAVGLFMAYILTGEKTIKIPPVPKKKVRRVKKKKTMIKSKKKVK